MDLKRIYSTIFVIGKEFYVNLPDTENFQRK